MRNKAFRRFGGDQIDGPLTGESLPSAGLEAYEQAVQRRSCDTDERILLLQEGHRAYFSAVRKNGWQAAETLLEQLSLTV